ncbi:family 16 glycoside hydrolase [Antarcticibacterium sp. 1MA-6-2]|uniref:family 16 glycoside hydrolase n=1 Tax=Antarcticibacterium sp. 1MA-6-2 TaxID=2908210 RepID=UPI002104392F|nr:family 16 glycoside hydrolase [Antarcticibacterium sp. 1MA-6-2]
MKYHQLLLQFLFPHLLLISLTAGCNNSGASNRNNEFVKIFDGKSLNGWEGDSTYWSVENGNLVGQITPSTPLKENTFIIWKDGELKQILN